MGIRLLGSETVVVNAQHIAHLVHQTWGTRDRFLADRFTKKQPAKIYQVLDPLEERILKGPKTPNAQGYFRSSTSCYVAEQMNRGTPCIS